MRTAQALAQRGLGRVWPNPSVGCVIVKDNVVIGRGFTADGGRPHAETLALKQARAQAKSADVYVTLEPCAHHGQTPPCAQSLIDSGVKRVIIGTQDPDPRTAGRGVEMLKSAGIEVVTSILEKECSALNAGFFNRIKQNRPFITLKMACSLDGKVATKTGQSQWITGKESRAHVHLQRARHDAVLAGIGTVRADDPLLTARVPGIDHNTVRIILDSKLGIDPQSTLVKSAKECPLWIFFDPDSITPEPEQIVSESGAKLFQIPPHNLVSVLEEVAKQGITRLFVEGGASVHSAFLKAGLFDQIMIYRSPVIIGEGKSIFSALTIERLQDAPRLQCIKKQSLGQDSLEIYEPVK